MKYMIFLVPILLMISVSYVLFNTTPFNLPKAAVTEEPEATVSLIPSPTPTPTIQTPLRVRGSIPYWDQTKAVQSFKDNVSVFTEISLFWYYVSDDGYIRKYNAASEDLSIIDFAHQHDVDVYVVITNLPENGGWDSDRIANIISDEERRKVHIEKIVSLIVNKGFDGLSLDYEVLDDDIREDFSVFVEELAGALHNEGKLLSVSLHPKYAEIAQDRYLYQDWERIARSADQLYIMAYGEHSDEEDPGPIASPKWQRKILEYAVELQLPKEKVFLGLPLYGYDWKVDSDEDAEGLIYEEATALINQYQVELQYDRSSPHFGYSSKDQLHEVWFEDSQSIEEKIKLARSYGVGGIAFWRLGGEDQQIWKLMTSE